MANGTETSPDVTDTDVKAEDRKTTVSESDVKPSISLRLIRHAESNNNQVYRNARYIYRGGTPEFDEEGWNEYVDTHRRADPGLSDNGRRQAQALSDYLVPHLENQASHPVRIVTSPMLRTLLTIRPTLERLRKLQQESASDLPKVHIIVNGYYHESEGCHVKDEAEEGMTPAQIRDVLKDSVASIDDIQFVGFPEPDRGWYVNATGPETRVQSEARAAKFYLWLCDYLDAQLQKPDRDLFDAGVQIQGEENECDHDKHGLRIRRRRTALLIGHGDFMSLVMKRIVAGYGHYVETEGIPHRSAFVHFNTGMSEFEYFGAGRYLVMATNQTPHFQPGQYSDFRTGGSLKDGWSYLMPGDKFVLGAEVDVGFSDELEDHVREQRDALKGLYLASKESTQLADNPGLEIEDDTDASAKNKDNLHFIVKRGLEVVGVATYSADTGLITDVAIRPTVDPKQVGGALLNAVKKHAKRSGRSGSLIVHPRARESQSLFQDLGFVEVDEGADVLEHKLD